MGLRTCFSSCPAMAWSLMITSIDVSKEMFSMDMLKALKSSLKHHRKHALRPLQQYGDQALRLWSKLKEFSSVILNYAGKKEF